MTNGLLDLGKGHPHSMQLPLQSLLDHATSIDGAETSNATEMLQYGPEAGSLRWREAVASLGRSSRRHYGDDISIMQTNGSSQGLDLVVSMLTSPGDIVLVELPAYFLVQHILEQHHVRPVQIPVVDVVSKPNQLEGSPMDLDKIEIWLEEGRIRPTLLYTVPICNNPLGCTMTPEQAKRLVSLAHRFGFRIASDEVYLHLQFDSTSSNIPFCSLLEFDNNRPAGKEAAVISLNSFSKILGPGIRLGWLESSRSIINRLLQAGIIRSGGGANPFAARFVAYFIEGGQQCQHLDRLKSEYSVRSSIICQAIETYMHAKRVTAIEAVQEYVETPCYVAPSGGFFVWVRLGDGLDAQILLDECTSEEHVNAGEGVKFLPGHRFVIGENLSDVEPNVSKAMRESIRLCFAWLERDELADAVKRIQRSIEPLRSAELKSG